MTIIDWLIHQIDIEFDIKMKFEFPFASVFLQVGKLADLVLWKPSFFGAKPEMVIKGGTIAWANMGDPNASIPTPEPVRFDTISTKKQECMSKVIRLC